MRKNLSQKLSRPGLRFGRLTLGAWIAVAALAVIVLAVILAPLLSAYDPNMQTVAADKAPTAAHLLGLDSQGRDILARLLYGGRWSLAIGLGATALALLSGAVVGAFAATSRRVIDETVMRVLDVIMAFPGIALAAVLVAVFGRDVQVLILAIAFLYMPSIARIVRANVQAQYGEDYIAAEHIIGAKRFFIVTRHVAVNIAAPVLVFCTVMVADAIVFEASLSFIGAGVQPPNPSWGSVISDGKNLLLTGGWWATLFPGLVIFATVLCLNVLAEGLTDAIAAPSAKASKAASQAVTAEAEDIDRGTDAVPAIAGLREAGARIRRRIRPIADVEPVLTLADLTISFPDRHNGVNVVNGVSFEVRPGEVLGLIGESGCGKSLTSLAVMGLEPRGAQIGGSMVFDGAELVGMRSKDRRALMGRGMSMIYQDALSSLNPAMTIKQQLTQLTRRGGRRTPAELLELVNLDPGRTLNAYPHELSGGQRQRVLIAMALSRDPKLIVADEPTTALDVTVQAQVMKLLLSLKEELGFALILVSHDLALVSDIVDRVVVMYGGEVAETGGIADVVGAPAHHYTRGLLSAVLSLESGDAQLTQIKGVVPSPAAFPVGCRFSDRCPAATALCRQQDPVLLGTPLVHEVACHHPARDVARQGMEVPA
ncbi:dipeptide/oligopeptide/nickel ABC transporter permease/ATP-binding protein [Microbacterium capsulatum]|uniref:Dipeptide/oligopeptide/nickel ABC transporter permease/ATP-binding protein n=1 Tax=Microbacterium capsulatum TaxID=3041921 RepID=A0ABU0XDA9_9MICO|nr:dipeptide/oligopeptide/nickel ABC transporter permease/ATP-binding protein [Microbacterium sp. ASV81]MDQ4213100.1 dipeptide/oligopeptide/nickel ABC transporter permease/ATP-binding protein [Microbacterium sp. ASV81]